MRAALIAFNMLSHDETDYDIGCGGAENRFRRELDILRIPVIHLDAEM
jgi:hypothetical protein